MEDLTNYWVVSLRFCCNDIYLSKERHLFKMIQIGAVGNEIWYEKIVVKSGVHAAGN